MSSSDRDALRTQLAVCFNRLTKGVEDAGKVDKVVLSLKETFYDSMCNLIRTWATRTTISKLPAEVLAMCIGCLPLRDRIVATHVSHAWRVAALTSHGLWSDILLCPYGRSSPHKFLGLVLDQSGNRPVDFEVDRPTHDISKHALLARELMRHMHHIRTIVWPDSVLSTMFDHPAPMLESFDTWGDGLQEDFLGGSAGRLRTLRFRTFIPPEKCPAVATVTDLECSLPEIDGSEDSEPSQLSRLFALFPQLRSLSLSSILPEQAAVLRRIRPPVPLSKLELWTRDPACDIFALYDAWRTSLMKDVLLGTPLESITMDKLAAYLSGVDNLTVQITIDIDGFLNCSRVQALNLDGSKHCLELHPGGKLKVDAGVARLGRYLATAQPSFAQLRSLTVPTAVFGAAVFRDVDLPVLKELILVYEEKLVHYPEEHWQIPSWPWYDLQPCVKRLLCRPVESVVVDMRRRFENTPPYDSDVRRLLREMRPIATPDPEARAERACLPKVQIRIRGVSVAVAEQLESDFQELGVTCDTEDLGQNDPR